MKQQPDNLFREKLENFQMTAPVNAWSKVEAGLNQTSHKGLWLKVAAGLALISVATILIWSSSDTNSSNSIGDNTIPTENKIIPEESVESTPVTDPAKQALANLEEKTERKQLPKAKNNSLVEKNTIAITIDDVPEYTHPVSEELIAEVIVPKVIIPETIDQPVETSSSVYLVYTAEVVNEKYLRKQPVDDATLAEKKSSRLQMLMGVAYNLKNGDNGFGDLRQMKDEIFALNFLEEKKQTKKN